MTWIYASRVIASVADKKLFWVSFMMNEIGYSVRFELHFVDG